MFAGAKVCYVILPFFLHSVENEIVCYVITTSGSCRLKGCSCSMRLYVDVETNLLCKLNVKCGFPSLVLLVRPSIFFLLLLLLLSLSYFFPVDAGATCHAVSMFIIRCGLFEAPQWHPWVKTLTNVDRWWRSLPVHCDNIYFQVSDDDDNKRISFSFILHIFTFYYIYNCT